MQFGSESFEDSIIFDNDRPTTLVERLNYVRQLIFSKTKLEFRILWNKIFQKEDEELGWLLNPYKQQSYREATMMSSFNKDLDGSYQYGYSDVEKALGRERVTIHNRGLARKNDNKFKKVSEKKSFTDSAVELARYMGMGVYMTSTAFPSPFMPINETNIRDDMLFQSPQNVYYMDLSHQSIMPNNFSLSSGSSLGTSNGLGFFYKHIFELSQLFSHCFHFRKSFRTSSANSSSRIKTDQSSLGLVWFIEIVRAFREKVHPNGNHPIIAHCSAGVGRSGTFIALDRTLQHIRTHDTVDIFSIVCEMRKERCHMVQNEQQYICIHQCLLWALEGQDDHLSPLMQGRQSDIQVNGLVGLSAESGI